MSALLNWLAENPSVVVAVIAAIPVSGGVLLLRDALAHRRKQRSKAERTLADGIGQFSAALANIQLVAEGGIGEEHRQWAKDLLSGLYSSLLPFVDEATNSLSRWERWRYRNQVAEADAYAQAVRELRSARAEGRATDGDYEKVARATARLLMALEHR